MGGMGSGSGGMGSGGMGGGMDGGGGGGYSAPMDSAPVAAPPPSRGKSKRGGLKLGSKGKKDNAFADKLLAEGQDVVDVHEAAAQDRESNLSTKRTSAASEVPKEPFHVRVAEEICVDANKVPFAVVLMISPTQHRILSMLTCACV